MTVFYCIQESTVVLHDLCYELLLSWFDVFFPVKSTDIKKPASYVNCVAEQGRLNFNFCHDSDTWKAEYFLKVVHGKKHCIRSSETKETVHSVIIS